MSGVRGPRMTAGAAWQPFQQHLPGATALSNVAQTRAGGVSMSSPHQRGDPPNHVRARVSVVGYPLDEQLHVTVAMFACHRPFDLVHHRAARIMVFGYPRDQQLDEVIAM